MYELWNGIAQNYKDQFWWNLAKIFQRLSNKICMLQFHVGLIFLSTLRLSNRTPKITRILTLYQPKVATLTPFSKISLIKNPTYQLKQLHINIKTEAFACFSIYVGFKGFWIFLPHVIKIDSYNFELYYFKVGAFLRHIVCVVQYDSKSPFCYTLTIC